ncbi:hypothetical protein B0181_07385 [Moraxella caviae]|uniref:Uncharacterized protein n=1 Tax=Moraxella caviae TaxID=34060 RepID=A0A1T0A0I4_9GAMM|nr:hypothetical protein B0181_07385 [Moraxella caviae]
MITINYDKFKKRDEIGKRGKLNKDDKSAKYTSLVQFSSTNPPSFSQLVICQKTSYNACAW